MKAVIYEKYGPPEVLQLRDIEKPAPKDNEVLIKIRATTVTKGDVRMRSFSVPRAQWVPARIYLGIRKPRRPILGMELAGDIESVGKDVTQFKVGDAVFASTFDADFGGYAEYKCLPARGLIALKPDNLTYEEAAALFGGAMTAVVCLKKAEIQPGQNVLIYGASGAVGTNAVQIAKNHFGATVTGVCSGRNVDKVMSLGADVVIDYTQEDFTQNDVTYDVIFDAVSKLPARQRQRAREKSGVYLDVHRDSHATANRNLRRDELLFIKSLIEQGKLRPFIDRCYPLEDIVEAHRYVDTGRKRGNVVITITA